MILRNRKTAIKVTEKDGYSVYVIPKQQLTEQEVRTNDVVCVYRGLENNARTGLIKLFNRGKFIGSENATKWSVIASYTNCPDTPDFAIHRRTAKKLRSEGVLPIIGTQNGICFAKNEEEINYFNHFLDCTKKGISRTEKIMGKYSGRVKKVHAQKASILLPK